MPTVAAIATAATAVAGTAYSISSAEKAKKAQKAQAEKLAGQGGEDVFGSIPEFDFEEYQTLESQDPGYAGIVQRILAGDIQNLPYASQLSGNINKQISKSTRQRIEGWDPSFMSALSTLQKTRNQTLKGRLPYEDALGIASDRGRLANDLGMAGGSGPQIAADLGLKRLDLMTKTGPGLTESIVNILQEVDPIQRHTTPQDWLLTPREGVPMAIQDNQFGAQFNMTGQLTEAYLGAMPNPAAQGAYNLQAFQAGMGSGGGGNSGQMIAAIGSAFQALGGINWGKTTGTAPPAAGGNGGYVGNPYGQNPVYAYGGGGPSYYYNNGWNAIPKATAA